MAKNYITRLRGEDFFTPNGKIRIKDEPTTPLEEDFGKHHNLEDIHNYEYVSMKKSLSMGDIAALREELLNLELESDMEAVHKRYTRPVTPQGLSETKYVSMAEAIYHYHRDTPTRFHSTRPSTFIPQGYAGRSELTLAQSPKLRCKGRSRTTHVISQQEKEEMEIAELKKYKIKANPIPKSIIEGTINLPEVVKKPVTVPEPFKLTEVHKKPVDSPDFVQFKARPAPKHILEKAHVPPKPPINITKAISPKLHYKRTNSADGPKCQNKSYQNISKLKSAEKPYQRSLQRLGPVRPEPFSFEKRDEELKRRKDERIKQQIEEERKQATLFKAQPLPGAVKKVMRSVSGKGSASTASSENKENHFKFEAKPPTVLYKQPFKPILQTVPIKPMPFALTTQKRAAEREIFDQHLKEKEEEFEKLKKEKEREQLEMEEKMKAELRAKLVHHAKPVPSASNNPFVPEKSRAAITVPETPKLVRRLKQQ